MRYVVGILMVLALMLIPASPAHACSGPEPSIRAFTEEAEVVAVGTLANPTYDVITLNVEEYLKGPIRAPALSLNNHTFSNREDCSSVMGPGDRFRAGTRVLAFLKRDEFKVGADWRPTHPSALHILPIIDGQLRFVQIPMGSLEDAKAEIAALAGPPRAPERPAAPEPRCFPETKQCIRGRFLEYWEQNGGLAVFGYPISGASNQVNRDTGKTYLTQWFERNRFELHPENARPYDVLLGRLGEDRLLQQAINWRTLPRADGAKAGCLWFAETRHNVCDQATGAGFKSYWQSHGLQDPRMNSYQRSLALFGLPLSEPRMETNTSGDRVLTQWFERARFEWHPDQPPEFKVLLGLLGNEVSGPCGPPPAGNFSAGPNARGEYCVKWKDTFTDERGFRIRIQYGRTNETFTYDVRANTTWFIVPAAEAPRFDPPACRRADYSLTVFALRPRGETIVNGHAVDSECGASLP